MCDCHVALSVASAQTLALLLALLSQVTALSFCPHAREIFLAGRDDGSVCLYHLSCDRPLLRFDEHLSLNASINAPLNAEPITSLLWAPTKPGAFWALQGSTTLLAFDLFKSMQSTRSGRGGSGPPATLVLAHASGHVAVHVLSEDFASRPTKSKEEARLEWRRKLRELESFVA
ncbi:hypothetical protein T492DRAFT_549026 [Pavlovales sp. CCMP2436]|nr:hypothetical protein T492DRAFT_549026 [Pavlovales sp. CCMP2436]